MSDQPLRILVLADAGSFHTERYVAELKRQGCELLLASLEEGRIDCYRLRRKGFVQAFWYVLAASEVKRLIRQFRPDIINPHFVSGYGFTVALAQVKRSVPVVSQLWGSDVLLVPGKSIFHARKTAYALNHADLLLADSQFVIDEARKLAEINNWRVIPCGIERGFLIFRRSDYKIGRPLRVIVPRPHEKVYDNFFIVQALAPMINAGLVKVTFPSFGSLAGHFRLNAKPLVGDSLRFYEPLDRSDFLKLMAEHDVYLSAAISDSSPVSLIEAMALGLIPVAANTPGVREWLGRRNGHPFELYDAAGLQKVIGDIIQGRADHTGVRERNLELVKRKGIFEENIAETIGLMRNLAAERKP
jgi:glycosyltransferase involved in cell wall biosynthesis